MCGIGGLVDLSLRPLPPHAARSLSVMNRLQAHRGPDGEGSWLHPELGVGFAHRRLAVLDLETGAQPMHDSHGNWITFSGEIYNHLELRRELGERRFRTTSDTEVLLEAYRRWGEGCIDRLRGMFAFALWDDERQTLFCARDRFGIKPFAYTVVGGVFYFASEAKALLPFLPDVETDIQGLQDYLSFQFCLDGKTLFAGVRELQPAHFLRLKNGVLDERCYWTLASSTDNTFDEALATAAVSELLRESIALHLRADVPVGAYVSGGVDSGLVASLAAEKTGATLAGFAGRFARAGYDEGMYARAVAENAGISLVELEIGADSFVADIERVVHQLDYPVAGPGAFAQYAVSRLAATERKVVLGGQGGDEVFGGYARYLIAHLEQSIKSAIGGGPSIVPYDSIVPNLVALRGYEPLLQEFWRDGLFDEPESRYFRLVNRAANMNGEVAWGLLGDYSPAESFHELFRKAGRDVSYFEAMTRFDMQTLLPALLHVEDRVSMAHGLESRVPILDHRLVETAAAIPASIRFRDGRMKNVLRRAAEGVVPTSVLERTDKMGFPVPFQEWLTEPGVVRDFVLDTLSSKAALDRPLIDNKRVAACIDLEPRYGRRVWGLLCLELWQRSFHDRSGEFRRLAHEGVVAVAT